MTLKGSNSPLPEIESPDGSPLRPVRNDKKLDLSFNAHEIGLLGKFSTMGKHMPAPLKIETIKPATKFKKPLVTQLLPKNLQ